MIDPKSDIFKRRHGLDLAGQSVFIEKGEVTTQSSGRGVSRLSRVSWIIARRQLVRLALFTAGLAPIVALVLVGLSRLQQNTPDWVYWKAELIFLIALEFAYGATASLSVLGTLVFAFLLIRRRSKGTSRPALARGLTLSIALLCSLTLAEAVCASWVSWSHRSTAVPVGGLGNDDRSDPATRFAQPLQQINLRTNFSDPPGDHEIDLVVMGESSRTGSSLRAMGCRSARSSPGNFNRQSPGGRST